MIPIVEQIKIGEKKLPDGRIVPVFGWGKTVGIIWTADELSRIFILLVYAEQDFEKRKRPDLAKRALIRAKRYSNRAVHERWIENRLPGLPAPSPKLAEFIFRQSYKLIVYEYQKTFVADIVAQ